MKSEIRRGKNENPGYQHDQAYKNLHPGFCLLLKGDSRFP